jgi:DNA ligase (NAD+)
VVARTLAKKYSCEDLINATEDDLSKIDGIGQVMAHGIHSWFEYSPNRELCFALDNYGLDMGSGVTAEEEKGTALRGLNVCFTGSSDRFKGDAVEEFLEGNGAKCIHGVNGKLNFLITGAKPGGSKVAKAKELGIEIIEEHDFYNKYGI